MPGALWNEGGMEEALPVSSQVDSQIRFSFSVYLDNPATET